MQKASQEFAIELGPVVQIEGVGEPKEGGTFMSNNDPNFPVQ
jgi:hypothetical protein